LRENQAETVAQVWRLFPSAN